LIIHIFLFILIYFFSFLWSYFNSYCTQAEEAITSMMKVWQVVTCNASTNKGHSKMMTMTMRVAHVAAQGVKEGRQAGAVVMMLTLLSP
jgi:hypothetical protein